MNAAETDTRGQALYGHLVRTYPVAGTVMVASFCIIPEIPKMVIIRAMLKQVAKRDVSA